MSMTVDELKLALPKGLQHNATQEFADKINAIAGDPEIAREVRDNFLTFSKVLQDGKFKTEDYLNAVTYATFKLMGLSNQDSYMKTFPDRYQALVARGATAKDISAYVAMYHKNKLVNQILEQATIPMWLLNQDAFQKAINTQLEIMGDATVNPRDRTAAANSLLTHLKQPETKKVELDVSVKQEGGIADLRATMMELANRQLELIEAGAGAKLIGARPLLLEAEVRDLPTVTLYQPEPVPDAIPVAAPAPPQPVDKSVDGGDNSVLAGLEDLRGEDWLPEDKPPRAPSSQTFSLFDGPSA